MKVVSDWIDNTKLRKPLYDFNQAVKLVYTDYRFIDGLVIPLWMKTIKTPVLFKKSMFYWHGTKWKFIENGAVDAEALNKALKNKGYDFREEGDKRILKSQKDGEEYVVSIKLTQAQIEDSGYYPGLSEVNSALKEEHIGVYELTEEDIANLLDYQSVDKIIANDDGIDVKLIMLKENFPMLKKADKIAIFVNKTKLDGVYRIVIKSSTDNWSFMSVHDISNY
jgi:hypothetical protein